MVEMESRGASGCAGQKDELMVTENQRGCERLRETLLEAQRE